ncbi:MAG TPA: 30S ribosome-binding factor RbfA [Candidatus Ozemobacteraceae bacterium]|nr:30S ribosome-binding factor RbfA [Candidatus Ozemobacteraceae bacterium]
MKHHRLERVASVLQHEIARIISQRIKDPRVQGMHIVSVDVSPDLHLARINYSMLDQEGDPEAMQKGLDSAKSAIRAELKKVLQLRILPELAFFFDPSIRQGDRLLELLRQIKPASPPESGEPGK